MKPIYTLFFLLFSISLFAQNDALVFGKVTDATTGEVVDFVNVNIKGTYNVAETDLKGEYYLKTPVNQAMTLVFRRVGYKEATIEVPALNENAKYQLDIALPSESSLQEVIIKENRIRDAGMIRENTEAFKLLPTTTGNLESVLPSIALGTTSGTGGELTSQYNVRGGNYDENLVYVNDFEIYRPQLIRAGQQEGLTFPNIDLIRDLSFSSGGFDAKYGDKMSSVLDIKYKRPDSIKASVAGSFLGASAHLEGSKKFGNYRKFRYLLGARYKTTRYLLGSLDVKGEYVPDFTDFQGYFTYDLNRDWQLATLLNYNTSVYNFTPISRSSGFGLINFALNLSTYYQGQERSSFATRMGGISLTYLPDRQHNPLYLKFLASAYQSNENERFDILGAYTLGELKADLGAEEAGEIGAILGEGIQHQYVRNQLKSNVINTEHKGGIEIQTEPKNEKNTASHFLQWSVKGQYELINDRLNEWERIDSAGHSLPYSIENVFVRSVLKTTNEINSVRLSSSFQDTYTLQQPDKNELKISLGVRAAYWNWNNEFFVTPRVQFLYKPLSWSKDMSFRLASGLYYQPPFYRELRNPLGVVSNDVLAQKSFHVIGGYTWDFYLGKFPKKFRFISEIYYKKLWDLVSYDLDNVRIRYSGKNDATGYATGIDMRINGEFVPNAESWVNLSFLRTRESIIGVQHMIREVGQDTGHVVSDVPRPTDQLMTMSMFFQDYLPKNKNLKMHMNFTVGTGFPYGLKDNNIIYRNTYRFSPYHRVDIGFSALLWDKSRLYKRPKHLLRFTKSTWASLEVFNLMQVRNQASNTWIKTIFSQQYAVPNYLTSRRINLRLRMEF